MIRCLYIGIMLLSSTTMFGQGLLGGIHLGGNASQVDGDQSAGFNQGGLSLGGFVVYQFDETSSLQVELLYEQLGSARQEFLILRNHQFSLPILFRYQLPIELSDGKHQIALQAGLSPGYLLSAKSEFLDVTDQLDRYDLRSVIGAEYQFGPGASFMMRYGYSIVSFLNTNAPLSSNLLGPGKVGLAHNYITLAFKFWLINR